MNVGNWPHLAGIDYSAGVNMKDIRDIKLLIGADVPECHIQEDSRVGKPGQPYAIKTVLGWSILGPLRAKSQGMRLSCNFVQQLGGEDTLNEQLKQYVGMEESRGK
jgi:hypothetical protein